MTSHSQRDQFQGTCDQLQGSGMSQVPVHPRCFEEEQERRDQLQGSRMSHSVPLRDQLQHVPSQVSSHLSTVPWPQSASGDPTLGVAEQQDTDTKKNGFGEPGLVRTWFREMVEYIHLRGTLPVQIVINEAAFILKKSSPTCSRDN